MLSTAAKDDSSSEVASPTTPSPPPPPPTTSAAATSASVAVDDKRASAGKKVTRQWEAWTHEEEESFFIALRNVGKNFDKITSRVQSKNKDQVRHYYYRVIRRINKLLGPGFSLDAKNTKDANSAMLRWWSLLEKQSCSASKLHLKPRRYKTFVTALEHQLLKDRLKANKKKKPTQAVSVVVAPVTRKPTACGHEAAKALAVGGFCSSKLVAGKNSSIKLRNSKRQEPLQVSKKRKKGADCGVSAAAIKRWEKAATAGVSLVAEAAEQVERAAAEQLGQAGPSLNESKLHSQSSGQAYPEAFLLSGQEAMQVDAVEYTLGDGKLKLQLYPIDEATRKSMEKDGVNPFLQLTLKQRKPVSSVVRHLIQKWGRSSAATGELLLFPFSAQVESMGTCQRWSLHDANVNAGDVYSALGNPAVFRLRYGWISPRVLQCAQAECLHLPVSSSVPAEIGLQSSAAMSMSVQPSAQVPPLASFQCFTSAETIPSISKGILCCSRNTSKTGLGTFVQGGETTDNELPFLDALKSSHFQSSSSGTVPVVAEDTKADLHSKQINSMENTPMSQGRSMDGLIQTNARNAMNIFGQSSADHLSDSGKGSLEMIGQSVQESGNNLAACSWLYEGSNDSFVQRIWALEDPSNAAPLLSTEMDWADTLTNISVGEFLNEVSQTAHMTFGAASIQALQSMQSLDSFDAAVAAHQSADVSGLESSIMQRSETPTWDGEETRDAFAFRKLVSQKQMAALVPSSLEPPNSTELSREPDGIAAPFVDCGSLEAWKQSFSITEISFPDALKYDSSSQIRPMQLECSGKGSTSQDFTWANVNKLHLSAHGSGDSCP